MLNPELEEQFEEISFLGRGGQGFSYRATRKSDQLPVVLKVLDFLELNSWKSYDLFMREIRTLRTLNHPAIPKLLGVYPENLDAEPQSVVLIQEYVPGDSLKDLLESEEEEWSTEDVLELLESLLPVLSYLHSLNPPVVHRDIKPSNIIRRYSGSYSLIDFGAASSTQKTNASTFVGTNGYMAPEQMMGRAEPCSDLYSLGATALHLATGIHPNDLAREDFSFRLDGLGLDPQLARVIKRLVEPLPENRFRSAEQVLASLRPSSELVLANVKENGFHLIREEDATRIKFPGPPLLQSGLFAVAAIFMTFLVALTPVAPYPYIMLTFFVGAGLYHLIRRREVVFENDELRYTKRIGPYVQKKSWKIDQIVDIRSQKRGAFLDVLLQDKDAQRHSLGWGFSNDQAQWLVRKLLSELEERR
ncbi:serine/threonine protein kinase [Microvenator marinus]|uniref:non-specific serine/threonine protein kinase n=1 Tax=Microvenator marinus TaxID=2600177 RepID=A0A5B8XS29_9DELT|nr:serine/threonine-protein kinase [Microvenator marinus]QED28470.1 serine/threonine protein kinase [Microvenator marinus]